MRRALALASLLGAFVLLPAGTALSAPAKANPYAGLSAREILDKVDDLFRGKSSNGNVTMSIVTPNWKRDLDLEFWSEGKEKSLVRISAPQKEKGTATLRVDQDIWNFLPKVKRVVKLPTSMMAASWMGSHFSNDDLVKETRMAEDYTFETTFDGEKDGKKVLEITCHPKPDAAVVWGKVIVHVDKGEYMPLFIEYFDEDLKLARTMTFSVYKNFGDRDLPSVVKLQPTLHPDESTTMTYHKILFDRSFPADHFSLRKLQE